MHKWGLDIPAFGRSRLVFALIEQPDEGVGKVIMQQCADFSDIQFFGGRVLAGERPSTALGRTLSWQLPGLQVPAGASRLLWQGMCTWEGSSTPSPEAHPPTLEEVTVFGISLSSDAELPAAYPEEAVPVRMSLEAVYDDYALESFTRNFLTWYINRTRQEE